MDSPLGDPDAEENPDVWGLFRHYDQLYFRGALVGAAFTVEWTSPRMKTITSGFGSCSFGKTSKTITLYQPMLQDRTSADLKNTLLHLMIHAIIFVKHGMTGISNHGPVFRAWMDAINACSIDDYLRPKRGYCITTTHDFSQEKICSIQGNLWKCELCGAKLLRATKLGPPSDSCCIENVSQHATCGNMLCYWHNHKIDCGGTYVVPRRRGEKMVLKGRLGLLSETSEMSKSQGGDEQESEYDELQANFTVAKPYAEGKLLSLVGGRNARSPGSSSSKKANKSNMPEDYQKEIVLPGTPRRKLGSCSSEKAEDFQKAFVLYASPSTSKLKRKQTSVASEKRELIISVGGRSNAESLISNTSSKAGKWHKPEHVQTSSSVQPRASRRKQKLEQDLDVSDKYGVSSFVGRSNANVLDNISSKKAHRQRKHDKETWRPIAAPRNILKQQQNKTNSSVKAGKKQRDNEDSRRTFFQPAVVSQRKLNPVAPKRTSSGSKTSSTLPKKKEYACVSVWANIYESECSSGSVEPLVNKRTERRKRERERSAQIAYSRSKKRRSASGTSSSIKAESAEEEISSLQTQPPSRCLDIVAIDAAAADEVVTQDPRDQSKATAPLVVMAQIPRGQSQPPTQQMDIAAAPPADQVMSLMTRGPADQSQPPAARRAITWHQVVQPHSADAPQFNSFKSKQQP